MGCQPGLEDTGYARGLRSYHQPLAAAREQGPRFSEFSREAWFLFLISGEIWFQMLATNLPPSFFLPDPIQFNHVPDQVGSSEHLTSWSVFSQWQGLVRWSEKLCLNKKGYSGGWAIGYQEKMALICPSSSSALWRWGPCWDHIRALNSHLLRANHTLGSARCQVSVQCVNAYIPPNVLTAILPRIKGMIINQA